MGIYCRRCVEERIVPVALQAFMLVKHLLTLLLARHFHYIEDSLDPMYSLKLIRLSADLRVA